MSRPSMSTGDLLISTRESKSRAKSPHGDTAKPMHIALIGDFSGRGSRGETGDIATRKAIEVDRDNFDEVFSAMKVALTLPMSETPIRFQEFEDLHPDTLFDALPLFEKFRTLKRKLKNPALFQQAADEITQWPSQKSQGAQARAPDPAASKEPRADATDEAVEEAGSMLDLLLSKPATAQQNGDNNIDLLIRDIVSPYIETKQDPRLPEFETAVEEAISHSMRRLMHSGSFQELEANWHGLYFLIRRLESSSTLKLFIVDITRDELVDDLVNSNTLEDSAIHRLLVEKYRLPGAHAFSILQCNFFLQDDIDDLRIAHAMALLAQANDAVALAGVSEKLAGCESLATHQDAADWGYPLAEHISASWEHIRHHHSAAHLGLVAPRFLLRMPYGKKSSPIDSFAFEELDDEDAHQYYCWGSGGMAVTLLLAQSYLESGWQFRAGQRCEIDDLPLHIYQDDGDSLAKACGEIFMTDSVANALADAGILSLRSVKGRAAISVSNFRSMAISGSALFAWRTA